VAQHAIPRRAVVSPGAAWLAITAVIHFSLALTLPAHAQPGARLRTLFLDSSDDGAQRSGQGGVFDRSLLPDIIVGPGESGMAVFDGYFMDNLRRLAVEANPTDSVHDFDEDRASHVAKRALAARLTDSVQRTALQSEFKDEYRSIIRGFASIKRALAYGVHRDAQGVTFGRSSKRKGKKILELQVEPSARTLFSPQLKVGEMSRLRYDTDNQGFIFEIRHNW
jgi:hypothetical protein